MSMKIPFQPSPGLSPSRSMRRGIAGLVVLTLFTGCETDEFVANNPLDPVNLNYNPPEVNILSGPSEGQIIEATTASFSWEGNQDSMLFRYEFDAEEWTEWTEDKSATLDYLDEGSHLFSLQSKYANEDTSEIATVNFSVNAVEGPALMFNPRRHVASVGEKVTFQIMAEEVESLTGVELNIGFDASKVNIESVSAGEMFQGDKEAIFHSEVDNDAGDVYLLSAILDGDSPSITGTTSIAVIVVEVLSSGITELLFDGSESFRDPDNAIITISEAIGGVVIAN